MEAMIRTPYGAYRQQDLHYRPAATARAVVPETKTETAAPRADAYYDGDTAYERSEIDCDAAAYGDAGTRDHSPASSTFDARTSAAESHDAPNDASDARALQDEMRAKLTCELAESRAATGDAHGALGFLAVLQGDVRHLRLEHGELRRDVARLGSAFARPADAGAHGKLDDLRASVAKIHARLPDPDASAEATTLLLGMAQKIEEGDRRTTALEAKLETGLAAIQIKLDQLLGRTRES